MIDTYKPFEPPLAPGRARALPPATVALGSMIAPCLPVVAHFAIVPPFGFLMLIAWRLLAPGSLRRWMPAALGLWDDLLSGQPLGSAVLFWSVSFFLVDLVDQRVMFRDFRLDWLIAAAAITLTLVGGRYVATPMGAAVDATLLAQIAVAVLAFPLAARLCAWLDRKRGPAA